ncbi:MAG: hypothetical protein GXP27_20335 [Planctomycetes bacterium]|nr:hypothetical protein [Planctomycetota bacterium]
MAQNAGIQSFDVLANDSFDGYAGPGRITSVSYGSQGGWVDIGPDGRSIRYAPPPGFVGTESLVYYVDDVARAEVTVTVESPFASVGRPEETYPEFWMVRGTGPIRLKVFERAGWPDERIRNARITAVSQETRFGGRAWVDPDGRSIWYEPAESFSSLLHSYEWSVDQNRAIRPDSVLFQIDGQYEAKVLVYVVQAAGPDSLIVSAFDRDRPIEVLDNDWYQFPDGPRQALERITALSTAQTKGTVRLAEDGRTVLYTPPADFLGRDSFSYIADGVHRMTVSIRVTQPARWDFAEAWQDGSPIRINVLANDLFGATYPGPREITAVSDPEAGSVAVQDGSAVVYTPRPGFVGFDRFTYTVDGQWTATVLVDVLPRAGGDAYRFFVDPSVTEYDLPVLRNDHFADGAYNGPCRITDVQQPELGRVEIVNDGTALRWTLPEPTRPTRVVFTYTVDGTYSAPVRVTVRGRARADFFTITQNQGETALEVLGNDDFQRVGDDGRPYSGARQVTAVSPSEAGGKVRVAADGKTILYTPPPEFVGQDRFVYTLDGIDEATVSVSVVRRLTDDRFSVEADSVANELPVLINDLFGPMDRGARRITAVTVPEAGGTVQIAPGSRSLLYTPSPGFVGTDTFRYTVDDQQTARVDVLVGQPAQETLSRFRSREALRQWLIDDALQRYADLFGQDAPPINPLYAPMDSTAGSRTNDHSDTNVQIPGVDEADLIENDGEFLYVLREIEPVDALAPAKWWIPVQRETELLIARAWPADQMQEVARVRIEGDPYGMYLFGDRLAVLSKAFEEWPAWDGLGIVDVRPSSDGASSRAVQADRAWADAPSTSTERLMFAPGFGGWPLRGRGQTLVTLLDVSDRSRPQLVQQLRVDGNFIDSRAIGGILFFIQRNWSRPLPPPRPQRIGPPEQEPVSGTVGTSQPKTRWVYESREEYRQRMEREIDDWLADSFPRYSVTRPDGTEVTGAINDGSDLYRIDGDLGSSLISIISVDMTSDQPGPVSTVSLLIPQTTAISANRDHLLLLSPQWDPHEPNKTRIFQFAWRAHDGTVQLQATGIVPGRLVDQFSVDEYDGRLRVATTTRLPGVARPVSQQNTVFLLQADHGVLEPIGAVKGLTSGTTVRGVRFIEDRAFVFTALVEDPLLAFDLSDPTAPYFAGLLAVPGISTYLHPIDATHLLAVGRDSRLGGDSPTQVALYDISDLADPVLLDADLLPKFSRSPAVNDHHAFGWFPKFGILALPSGRTVGEWVDLDGDGSGDVWRRNRLDELVLFRIDVRPREASEEAIQVVGTVPADSEVLRPAYIGQTIYAVTNESILAVSATSPGEVIGVIHFGRTDPIDVTPDGGAGQDGLEEKNPPPIPFVIFAGFDTDDQSGWLGGRWNVPGAAGPGASVLPANGPALLAPELLLPPLQRRLFSPSVLWRDWEVAPASARRQPAQPAETAEPQGAAPEALPATESAHQGSAGPSDEPTQARPEKTLNGVKDTQTDQPNPAQPGDPTGTKKVKRVSQTSGRWLNEETPVQRRSANAKHNAEFSGATARPAIDEAVNAVAAQLAEALAAPHPSTTTKTAAAEAPSGPSRGVWENPPAAHCSSADSECRSTRQPTETRAAPWLLTPLAAAAAGYIAHQHRRRTPPGAS